MKKKTIVPREKQQLQKIGRAFRIRRLDRSLKLQDLESQAGVSSLTISKLEKGQLDNSSLQTLNKIADVLGLKINLTITGNEQEDND